MIDLGVRLDDLSDEQRMLRDAAAAYFASTEDGRQQREWRNRSPGYDRTRWREMAGLGWTGMRLPEEHGGSACSLAQLVVLLEQCGRSLAPEPLVAGALLPASTLLLGDNESLRDLWLPRLARGESVLALAGQERANDAQADMPMLQGQPAGEGVVLSGSKRFVVAGDAADAFIVSASTSAGMALFLVESGSQGMSWCSQARVDGSFCGELHLDEVAVPSGQLVAGAGSAPAVLQRALDEARIAVSAELLGVMARALETSVEYIKLREQFGRPVGSFQALQHRAVDLLIQVELARAAVVRAASLADSGAGASALAAAASQAKARASDAALKVTQGCIQLHGGIGYTDECSIGLYLKKAMVLAAWLGNPAWHRRRHGELATADGYEPPPDQIAGGAQPIRGDELRRWISDNYPAQWRFPPSRMSLHETGAWHRQLNKRGWVAPNWPKEYGGMGLSAWEQVAFQAEFDRHGIHIAPNMGVVMLGPLLIRYGSESQKRDILPKILAGEVRWCQGYSEPSAGSDLASLRTRAELDGEYFVVNGQKIWTSFAHEADMIFLLVRTDPKAKKQEGISFLLADMKSPGISVRRIRNLSGNSEFCEVFFDNVRVPRSNLVGELNQGWTMAKSLLGSERITIGHPRLARTPLLRLRELAELTGAIADPAWRARYDELRLDVDDLDALFVRYVDVLRRGRELGPEVSILKIWVTEAFQRVADLMLETAGEAATLDEAVMTAAGGVHVANVFFAARPASIYGGSNEIQRNILARAVLQLPA